MNLSDFITAHSTQSVNWTEELRRARLEYAQHGPLGQAESAPASREERALDRIDSRLAAALRATSISVRFREATIVRACLRLGIPASAQIRILGALVV